MMRVCPRLFANYYQFPSKPAIATYLKQHPLTKDPRFTTARTIELAARNLANSRLNENEVKRYAIDMAERVNIEHRSDFEFKIQFPWAISKALLDCAKGRSLNKIEKE
jgi:hypothetical protein